MVVCCVLCCLALAGCSQSEAGTIDPQQDTLDVGSQTPEETVASFFAEFNAALSEPSMQEPDVRRAFAERLAGYFAPVERIDQRAVFLHMLSQFAESQQTLEQNEQWVIQITFAQIEVERQDETHARVRLVDAFVQLRRIRHQENYEEVLFEQQKSLAEVLPRASNLLTQTEQVAGENWAFNVLQVNGRWFLTESSL